MVWVSQDSCDDANGIDCVKAKPLKRRCAGGLARAGGLSRYYSSKSQSFSSLELVQRTPYGNSSLALAKRPSSYDLQAAGCSTGRVAANSAAAAGCHSGSPRSSRAAARFASAFTVCGMMGTTSEQCEEEGYEVDDGRLFCHGGGSDELLAEGDDDECEDGHQQEQRGCPCNDTIFADPSDAFISPEGSPSASPLQGYDKYDSCSLSYDSCVGGGESGRTAAVAAATGASYHQQQLQLQLTAEYCNQLAAVLLPMGHAGGGFYCGASAAAGDAAAAASAGGLAPAPFGSCGGGSDAYAAFAAAAAQHGGSSAPRPMGHSSSLHSHRSTDWGRSDNSCHHGTGTDRLHQQHHSCVTDAMLGGGGNGGGGSGSDGGCGGGSGGTRIWTSLSAGGGGSGSASFAAAMQQEHQEQQGRQQQLQQPQQQTQQAQQQQQRCSLDSGCGSQASWGTCGSFGSSAPSGAAPALATAAAAAPSLLQTSASPTTSHSTGGGSPQLRRPALPRHRLRHGAASRPLSNLWGSTEDLIAALTLSDQQQQQQELLHHSPHKSARRQSPSASFQRHSHPPRPSHLGASAVRSGAGGNDNCGGGGAPQPQLQLQAPEPMAAEMCCFMPSTTLHQQQQELCAWGCQTTAAIPPPAAAAGGPWVYGSAPVAASAGFLRGAYH